MTQPPLETIEEALALLKASAYHHVAKAIDAEDAGHMELSIRSRLLAAQFFDLAHMGARSRAQRRISDEIEVSLSKLATKRAMLEREVIREQPTKREVT